SHDEIHQIRHMILRRLPRRTRRIGGGRGRAGVVKRRSVHAPIMAQPRPTRHATAAGPIQWRTMTNRAHDTTADGRIDASDVALVLEGGGMRNAYTAPCIEVLLRNGVDVGWVGGISAGATLTANYLSGSIDRARGAFTTMTDNPEFGGWGSFLRG